MQEYKFIVGEKVQYNPGFAQDRESGAGIFEIVRSMPDERDGPSYRIRHVTDSHERVVREHQLNKVVPDEDPSQASA